MNNKSNNETPKKLTLTLNKTPILKSNTAGGLISTSRERSIESITKKLPVQPTLTFNKTNNNSLLLVNNINKGIKLDNKYSRPITTNTSLLSNNINRNTTTTITPATNNSNIQSILFDDDDFDISNIDIELSPKEQVAEVVLPTNVVINEQPIETRIQPPNNSKIIIKSSPSESFVSNSSSSEIIIPDTPVKSNQTTTTTTTTTTITSSPLSSPPFTIQSNNPFNLSTTTKTTSINANMNNNHHNNNNDSDNIKKDKKRKYISKENEVSCPICLDHFHINGKHRAIVLKSCGHIFGKECVETWVKEKKLCPNCKKKATLKDIIPIFLPNGIREVDPNQDAIKCRKVIEDRDKEIQSLNKKIVQLKQRLSTKTSINTITNSNNNSSFNQFGGNNNNNGYRLGTGNINYNNNNSSSRIINNGNQKIYDNFDGSLNFQPLSLFHLKGSKVFDFSNQSGIITASFSKNQIDYGIVKLSSLDPSNTDHIANLHKGTIRDVKINKLDPTMIISISSDKSIKLINIHNKSVMGRFELGSPGWSCEFDPHNSFQFFASELGKTHLFDIRKLSDPVESVVIGDGNSPVYKILYSSREKTNCSPLLSGDTIVNSNGGIFSASDQLYYSEKSNTDDSRLETIKIPNIIGDCNCISLDETTNTHMATIKSSSTYQFKSLFIFKLLNSNRDSIQEIKTIYTEQSQPQPQFQSKSIIFTSISNNQVFASTTHPTDKIIPIWNSTTGNLSQVIKTNHLVSDLLHFNYKDEEFLLSLSDSELHIFKNI